MEGVSLHLSPSNGCVSGELMAAAFSILFGLFPSFCSWHFSHVSDKPCLKPDCGGQSSVGWDEGSRAARVGRCHPVNTSFGGNKVYFCFEKMHSRQFWRAQPYLEAGQQHWAAGLSGAGRAARCAPACVPLQLRGCRGLLRGHQPCSPSTTSLADGGAAVPSLSPQLAALHPQSNWQLC